MRFLPVLILMAVLAGCSGPEPSPAPEEETPPPIPEFTSVTFEQLTGWDDHQPQEAFAAFLKSCESLMNKPADRAFKPFGTYGDWHNVCKNARQLDSRSAPEVRNWFRQNFTPYRVALDNGGNSGLFTGYYEPSLHGSRTRRGNYQTPLYAKPKDMITADLGRWDEELEGRKLTGRVVDGKFVPYADRAEISADGLKAAVPIAWVDDPVDAFFLHIQGSGQVKLQNGEDIRVGYAGQNGHEYYAIGRELIKRGELSRENVSLQSIRYWMAAHPEQAMELMNLNPSYIFFRELKTTGPLGAQGVVLTPGRSLAVDDEFYSYGLPVWLETEPPVREEAPLKRLMVAQDTGGAITGPIRGDVFWGPGPRAEFLAGHMKARGGFSILIPKNTISPAQN